MGVHKKVYNKNKLYVTRQAEIWQPKSTKYRLFPVLRVFHLPASDYLSHNPLQQSLIAIHNIVNNILAGNGFEMFSCAVNLGLLNQPQLH